VSVTGTFFVISQVLSRLIYRQESEGRKGEGEKRRRGEKEKGRKGEREMNYY